MLNKPLEEITADDLQQLIDDQMQEGKTIDYKAAMYRVERLSKDGENSGRQAERDKGIREFLKDVSSFANTVGGHLIIGMRENNGIPTEICGVDVEDPDGKKLQLDELLQKWLEPRISSTIHFIKVEAGRFVFIIRVLQSMVSPHRVTYQDFGHFFARNSGGVYRMDTSNLRTAFTLSETIFERIKSFRKERVEQIKSAQAPVPLPPAAKMILHLIPLDSLVARISLDVNTMQSMAQEMPPPSERSCSNRLNMDGLVTFSGGHLSQVKELYERAAYAQVFRNGILEVVQNGITYRIPNSDAKDNILHTEMIEPNLFKAFPRYLQCFKQVGISPPIWCFLTLTGVDGATIQTRDSEWHPPIDRPDLFLPESLINDLEASPSEILTPLFHMIWNSAGWPCSPNFDDQGDLLN